MRVLVEVVDTAEGRRFRLRLDEQALTTGATRVREYPALVPGLEPDPGPIWLRLLCGIEPGPLAKDAQIRIERTSYSRAGQEVLWVLGAGPQDPTGPQWQVERRTGKLRVTVERDRTRVELDGVLGEAPELARWPRRVTFRDERGVKSFEVVRLQSGAAWPLEAPGSP
jgi:hypothetical protein